MAKVWGDKARELRLLNDRALADRARQGERGAFEELYRRHAPGAWRLSGAVDHDPTTRAAALAGAFAAVLGGRAPVASIRSVRGQLLAATRARLVLSDVELSAPPASAAATPQLASARSAHESFDRLPERLRSALWLSSVEGLPGADVAVALGTGLLGVEPLVARAQAGLRRHHAVALVAGAGDCDGPVRRILPYADGQLSGREELRVRAHLDACAECRERLASLDDVVVGLAPIMGSLPATLAPVALASWQEAVASDRGPLHVTLPGGHPVPAWVERTVAGAAAALIALGISGAVLVAGRGSKVRDDGIAKHAAAGEPVGIPDGESALPLPPTKPLPVDNEVKEKAKEKEQAKPAIDPKAGSDSRSKELPAGPGAGPAQPAPGDKTKPAPPPPPASPPTKEPSGPGAHQPPPPSADEKGDPLAQVGVKVDKVLALDLGDECAGIKVLDIKLGCTTESAGGKPLEISIGGQLLPPIKLG